MLICQNAERVHDLRKIGTPGLTDPFSSTQRCMICWLVWAIISSQKRYYFYYRQRQIKTAPRVSWEANAA